MKTARMIENMKKKGIKLDATKEDVERNLELLKKGKPLDIPLTVLDGKLKTKSYFTEGNYKDNPTRCKSYFTFYHIRKNKKKLKDKVEWCLWFLYYYIKFKESKNGNIKNNK